MMFLSFHLLEIRTIVTFALPFRKLVEALVRLMHQSRLRGFTIRQIRMRQTTFFAISIDNNVPLTEK